MRNPNSSGRSFSSLVLAAIGGVVIAFAIFLQAKTTIPAWKASSPLELCTDLVSFLCLIWTCARAAVALHQGERAAPWLGLVAAAGVFFVGQVTDLLLSANALIDEEWLDDAAGYKLSIAGLIVVGGLLARRYLPQQRATRRWLFVAASAFVASTIVESLDDIEAVLFSADWSASLKQAIWGARTQPFLTEASVETFAEALELLALVSVFASFVLIDVVGARDEAGALAPNGVRMAKGAAMARYALWRAQHPAASFSDYYQATVERTLRRKGRHAALMTQSSLTPASAAPFGVGSLRLAREVIAFARALGLRNHHRLLDYGCGSLRLGRLLIPELDRGNYLGLDVTDRFYQAGLATLDRATVVAKAPTAGLITDATIGSLAAEPPDFLLCFAVVQHIPPGEIDGFCANIVRAMGPRTQALISFKSSVTARRFRAASWNYSAERLILALHEAGLRQPVRVVPPSEVFANRAERSIWFLQIGPREPLIP